MKTRVNIESTVTLNNGVEMPRFGLGVWSAVPGDETFHAVCSALGAGYRMIDTAEGYRNEADVGRAVRECGIDRREIFVTTKLAVESMKSYDTARRAFDQSMEKLGLDDVDLYLLHWPVPGGRKEAWRALETLSREKRVRAIGVSNYTIRHLNELASYASLVPAVNQVEFSPFLYQRELLGYCRKHNIQLEAYSPLTRRDKMGHPAIAKVAGKHGKTPAQVMIRWALEHDVVVIPKSAKAHRIQENANVFDFELDAADLQVLDSLNEDYRCNPDWNPERET